MAEHVQVTTTTHSRESAVELGRLAVAAAVAASAQVVGPMATIYRHHGAVTTGEEWSVLLKTTRRRYPELERLITANHPYDKPEVTAVPLVAGAAGYLEWIDSATTP